MNIEPASNNSSSGGPATPTNNRKERGAIAAQACENCRQVSYGAGYIVWREREPVRNLGPSPSAALPPSNPPTLPPCLEPWYLTVFGPSALNSLIMHCVEYVLTPVYWL